MYHRNVIAAVARRLPHQTQSEVSEVIEVLAEIWLQELAKGGEVMLPDIGRLRIEVQDMTAGGVLAKHGRLQRVYGRFRPTPALKAKLQEVEFE